MSLGITFAHSPMLVHTNTEKVLINLFGFCSSTRKAQILRKWSFSNFTGVFFFSSNELGNDCLCTYACVYLRFGVFLSHTHHQLNWICFCTAACVLTNSIESLCIEKQIVIVTLACRVSAPERVRVKQLQLCVCVFFCCIIRTFAVCHALNLVLQQTQTVLARATFNTTSNWKICLN